MGKLPNFTHLCSQGGVEVGGCGGVTLSLFAEAVGKSLLLSVIILLAGNNLISLWSFGLSVKAAVSQR